LNLVSDKPHLEISVVAHAAKIVAIGPVGSSFDLQITRVCTGDAAACGDGVTVGSVKKELAEKHNIKWAVPGEVVLPNDPALKYRLSKLYEDRVAEKALDDDDELLDWGSLLMMIPTNTNKLLLLPPVQLDLPADSIEIDGQQLIPVNVKASGCDSEQYMDLLLPHACTVQQLKLLLRDAGVEWAVEAGSVRTFFSKQALQGDAVIPAACDLPLKVVQVKGAS
jgi:hypothetical protein